MIRLLVLMLLIVASPSGALAFDRPLLVDGKKALYQRVLSRPSALIYSAPQLDQQPVAASIRSIDPFSVLYVYERRSGSNGEWLQVGRDTRGDTLGWIAGADSVAWKQALTVSFKDAVNNDRVLMLRDVNALRALVDAPDAAEYERLYREAELGQVSDGSPVVAIQPRASIDIRDNFYLVPITRYEERFLGAERARLLEVSSIPLKPEDSNQAQSGESESGDTTASTDAAARPTAANDDAYRSGLMFVVDSTASMGPYINRTRKAVRQIFEGIGQAGLDNQVSFGLIAHRDSLEAVPALGYLAKTFANLEQGRSAAGFFSSVNAVSAANVSSRGFIEDSFAGVKKAIEDIDWSPFAARYVVLVTDAGPRTEGDLFSSTQLDVGALRQLALDKNISIFVLHLKTPVGRRNHVSAEQQYRALSYFPAIGEFYYSVDMGNVDEFGSVLDSMTQQIVAQVRETQARFSALADAQTDASSATGQAATTPAKPSAATSGSSPTPSPSSVTAATAKNAQLAAFQEKLSLLGNALQLRYLQQRAGETIPDVFTGWLVDRDIHDPARRSVDVRVLLTRDQLSDLQNVLKQVLQTAEEGVLSPANFLDDLRSLAASISRDPSAVAGSTRASSADAKNLADMGYMREYIEDLPYSGEIMNLGLDEWEQWPAKQQLAFIHRLEAKIRYYQALHDNTDLWVSLAGGPINGDSVFPMVLEQLP